LHVFAGIYSTVCRRVYFGGISGAAGFGGALLLLPLLAHTDLQGAPPVAVVNETLGKKYFPGINPVGKQLLVRRIVPGKTQLGEEIPWEIVGVVADEQVGGLDSSYESPGMYVPSEQSPVYSQSVLIRSTIDTALLRDPVKRTVHEINPDQVVADLMTLDLIKAKSLGNNRYRTILLGVFAGIALLLAATGIYRSFPIP
jgi:putative ABC transport system permease protein